MGVKVRQDKRSGAWYLYISHHGRRKSKRIGHSKSEAVRIAKEVEARLARSDLGLFDDKPKSPKFREYSEQWLETFRQNPSRKISTYTRYLIACRKHLWPVFGNKRLDEIDRKAVRDFLKTKMAEKLSASAINIIRVVISSVMDYAVEDEYIDKNPTVRITKTLGLSRKRNKEVAVFTPVEVRSFLDTCWRECSVHYPLFLTAFRTGMRPGELMALRWEDIDWSGRFIEVRRSYTRRIMGTPKSGKSRRVDMTGQLSETLKGLYDERRREAQRTDSIKPLEFIFTRTGKPMDQQMARSIFQTILGKAEMSKRTLKSTRHTFASLLLSAGKSSTYVRDQMGHSSILITVDVYGKWIPSDSRGVDVLDDANKRKPDANSDSPEAVNYRQ